MVFTVSVDARCVTYLKDIAESFNNDCISISQELQKKISLEKQKPENYLKNVLGKTFFIAPTTSEEVEDVICTLNSGKSTGPSSA